MNENSSKPKSDYGRPYAFALCYTVALDMEPQSWVSPSAYAKGAVV